MRWLVNSHYGKDIKYITTNVASSFVDEKGDDYGSDESQADKSKKVIKENNKRDNKLFKNIDPIAKHGKIIAKDIILLKGHDVLFRYFFVLFYLSIMIIINRK